MLEKFKNDINNFYTGDIEIDRNINLKYNHSIRVMNRMIEFARVLNFNDEEILLAQIIGLLHDYGRFYQMRQYQTFNDGISIDHADYGIVKLFDEGEIIKYYDNVYNYDLISKAIKYHNKFKSPDDDFCKLIRDVDKIDILYQFGDEISFTDEGEISYDVINDFNSERLVSYGNINSPADSILKNLAYIYDLNYLYSYQYIINNHILENFLNNINETEKFEPYFEKVDSYIKGKVKEIEKC